MPQCLVLVEVVVCATSRAASCLLLLLFYGSICGCHRDKCGLKPTVNAPGAATYPEIQQKRNQTDMLALHTVINTTVFLLHNKIPPVT